MDKIDYSHCSKADLEDVLNHIDREKFPERTALAQSLYDSKDDSSDEESEALQEASFAKNRTLFGSMFFIFTAPFVLIYGVQSDRLFYTINIESLWARILTSLLMLSFGIFILVREWSENEN